MKKFLFTLASIVAFGLAANAGAQYSFSQNEITLGAGESQEVYIVLTSIDEVVGGLQMELNMVDPNGELLMGNGGAYLDYKYGTSRRHQFFAGTGISVDNEDAVATSDGEHTSDATMVYQGRYVAIMSNTATNVCFYDDEVCPANVLVFTVTVGSEWQDEYADLICVKNLNSYIEPTIYQAESLFAPLRIINKDYVAPAPQQFEGQIVIGEPTEDGQVAISYTGSEDVTMVVTLNGEVVEVVDGAIQLVEGANVIAVTISAEGYEDLVATAEYEWTAPVVPVYTDKPVITVVDDPEAQTVTVTATGNGHICLYWDDQLVAEGEGEAVWVIAYGDEAEEYGVSATAQEEGKEVSEYALETVEVPQKIVVPVYTDKPVITVVDDPEAQTVTVTATGNGHICLYWDDQLVAEGEGEAVWVIAYGDEAEEYGVSATAQEEGKEVSDYALETVEVPQKSDVPGPVDPTDEGYWLILVWADGTEVPVELMLGYNGDYVNVQNLEYPQFVDVACFYFKINGVAYGANEDMTLAFLGDADQNPLTPNTNVYYVDNGYSYTIGVHLILDKNTGDLTGYSAYVAKGGPVDVDELVNGKTVAGVRYFNLAGQEMQEANGMTIVVTTYTDGTTSAVKVMK